MDPFFIRQEYGDVFVTHLVDGTPVPWKPLSIGEFLYYQQLDQNHSHPVSILEDEIFKKCVLDPVLVKNIGLLKAGDVSLVVASIMAYSGPASAEDIQHLLDINRKKATELLHQLVNVIVQAYPAYKPEDIYNMDYTTFMFRVAQAEEKGIRTQFLKEPLEIIVPGKEEKQSPPPRKPQVDSKRLFDRQQSEKKTPKKRASSTEQTIIGKNDIIEHQFADNNDPVDSYIKLRDTAKSVYQDYLEQAKNLKPGEKIEIKSVEERVAEAKARAEANRLKMIERTKQNRSAQLKEREELLKVREKARERKNRKLSAKKR